MYTTETQTNFLFIYIQCKLQGEIYDIHLLSFWLHPSSRQKLFKKLKFQKREGEKKRKDAWKRKYIIHRNVQINEDYNDIW